jgi:hypothetical protein
MTVDSVNKREYMHVLLEFNMLTKSSWHENKKLNGYLNIYNQKNIEELSQLVH